MPSSKAGFHQKDGSLMIFDQLSEGDDLVIGPSENDLNGLEIDANHLLDLSAIQDFRLGGTSGDSLDSTVSSTTLYLTPYRGNKIALYNTTEGVWEIHESTEVSLSTSGFTAARPHDIFAYDNSGTLTLESVAWSTNTARSTALTKQNGVYVKSGNAARRYVGSVYVDGSKFIYIGTYNHYIWNYYNRVLWSKFVREGTNNWNYNSSAWRALNNSTTNAVNIMQGVQEDYVIIESNAVAFLHKNEACMVGIGIDSTTVDSATLRTSSSGGGDGDGWYNTEALRNQRQEGFRTYYALERSDGNNITFYSNNNTNVGAWSGIRAEVWA